MPKMSPCGFTPEQNNLNKFKPQQSANMSSSKRVSNLSLAGQLPTSDTFVDTQPALSPATRERKHKHYRWPAMCAYLIYDLASPVFSTSELEAIFSGSSGHSPTSPALSNSSRNSDFSASSQPSDGWGTFLNSRIEHITNRPPNTRPTAVCVGEYSSASVFCPCQTHGVGQIFHGWNDHPAVKHFKEMIASSPIIRPSGNGPAQILKAYLDEFTGRDDPLSLTWVMKFLLLPKNPQTAERWSQTKDWQDLCSPENLEGKLFKPVVLICVRRSGLQKEELSRKFIEFGRLFSVEVVIVSSLG